MTSPLPFYGLAHAESSGRDAACKFVRRRAKDLLALRPENPYLKATAEEWTAWEKAFDSTMEYFASQK